MHTPTKTSVSNHGYASKKRQTRQEKFLAEMAQLEPHYPRNGRLCRQPMGLERMLHIHCMQQWFSYSDRQLEDELYKIDSIRRFSCVSNVTEAQPDETTILNFRLDVEKLELTGILLPTATPHQKEQELLASKDTVIDTTIVHAPCLTKTQDQARNRNMHLIKKGNPNYFGIKIHVDAGVNSGSVHSVTETSANTANILELCKENQGIFIEVSNTSAEYKKQACHVKLNWSVNDNRSSGQHKRTANTRRLKLASSIFSESSNANSVFARPASKGLEKNTVQRIG